MKIFWWKNNYSNQDKYLWDTHWPKTIKAVNYSRLLTIYLFKSESCNFTSLTHFLLITVLSNRKLPEPGREDQFFLRPLKVRLRNISEPDCVHHKQVTFIDYLSNHKNNYQWQIASSKIKVAELRDWGGKLLTAATSQSPVTGKDHLNISMKRTCISKR